MTLGPAYPVGDGADLSNLSEDAIPVKDSTGNLVDSGMRKLPDGTIQSDKSIELPNNSLDFADVITQSEGTSSIIVRDKVNDRNSTGVMSVFTNSGSQTPSYFKLAAQTNFVVNSDFSQNLTANPLTFQLTATNDAQVNVLHFKTGSAMTNVRIRVADNATDTVLRYLPSKAAWNSNTGGFSFVSGDNIIDLISVAADSPGVINLGVTPFRFTSTELLDIEVRADAVDLLGNVGGIPFLNVDEQVGVDTDIVEVGLILESFDANDAIYPASNPAVADSRNGHPIIAFDDTVAENVVFNSSMVASYNGIDISIDIDWVAETAITGGVTWGVEIERNAPGGTDIDSDSFAAQQTGTNTTSGTSGIITRTTITLTQAEADAIEALDSFRMRLQRVVGDVGDDMTGNAQVLTIGIK